MDGTPRALTLDATGTLFHSPRLVAIYAEVLARHGVTAPPETLERLIPEVFQELACSAEMGQDRFTAHPEGARGWWRWFLERLCERLEARPPSRFAAAELYARFAHAEAWEVFPEVRGILAELAGMGLPMAVVANWDERLPGLLEELGLGSFFAAVVFSAEVGVEKPHPAIFHAALEVLGVAPEEALHVGDRMQEDVEGALATGMEALLLVRPETAAGRVAVAQGAGGDLADLAPLPELLALEPARPPFPFGVL
ncbi:MAG TPA: HAD-IA family hydrolase [Thermoanaerobaculia bacterium]|nr:HAD-IA family hydrolase [Thermoanaerobaculia bacterium]